eukprot:CAMPEP_0119470638 /NCGR_PEP_ID=MMETSP1344-20130328/3457_1 /TAXON_ID=236787 /ORGANISM="Florenciella parvula, Strain CCMP2471" /LENGTH=79 /DNA_ID=CAMNT_0007503339 /DNA_START=177 /DNA_END=417 /DNA_ORIENTATION=-
MNFLGGDGTGRAPPAAYITSVALTWFQTRRQFSTRDSRCARTNPILLHAHGYATVYLSVAFPGRDGKVRSAPGGQEVKI